MPSRPFFAGGAASGVWLTADAAALLEASDAPHSGHFVKHPRESRSGAGAGERLPEEMGELMPSMGSDILYFFQAKSFVAAIAFTEVGPAASHSALIS